MENNFFVEVKSFVFLVANGSNELRMLEKRKGFSGFVLLSSRCTVWLVSMVEDALRSTVSKDFVKSFREGSKVTIVRSGANRCGRFLEVAVYAMGSQRGMTMFLEGRDRQGWRRDSRELSKAPTFLEATVKAPYAGGPPVVECLGSRPCVVCGGSAFRAYLPFLRWWASSPVYGGGLV